MSEENRKVGTKTWYLTTVRRTLPEDDSTAEEVEQEVEWIEATLTATLNRRATPLRVTVRSKKLSTAGVATRPKVYGGYISKVDRTHSH